jgi:peptide/nickel transport system substrate-binding protein
MRHTVARFVAGAVLCAFVAGCSKVGSNTTSPTAGSTTAGRHTWTRAGYLRIGIQAEPATLNPLLAGNTTEAMIGRLIFDPLVTVDETGKNDVPVLAAVVPTLQNGGISKDGLTITYHLRHNIKWHDGFPFTSKDVKFSWKAILDKNNNVETHTGYELASSVDTPDDYTVVFHMKKPFSPAVDTLFGDSDSPYSVVPEHLLASLPNINTIPFNSMPIGTGPYKIVRWVHGDHIDLEANRDYFLGRPKIEHITIKTIPDENTEVNQLRTHDLDWQFEASPDHYNVLKTVPDITLVLQDRNEFERFDLNTVHPPLDDVRVRQAISYTIDRAALVARLTGGSAAAADQDLPPFLWAHSSTITHYPPDTAKAKALLAQAGFAPGPDGILVRNGKRLSLVLVTNVSNSTRKSGVVQIQSMLRTVGIDVEVKTYTGTLLFETYGQGGILQTGKYDMAWTGWVSGVDPDNSSLYVCSARPPGGNNDTRYCKPEMDAAQTDALTHFDRPTRKKAYDRIETMLTRDIPTIPIWWPRQIQPINPDFKNFKPNPVTADWNAYQWDI